MFSSTCSFYFAVCLWHTWRRWRRSAGLGCCCTTDRLALFESDSRLSDCLSLCSGSIKEHITEQSNKSWPVPVPVPVPDLVLPSYSHPTHVGFYVEAVRVQFSGLIFLWPLEFRDRRFRLAVQQQQKQNPFRWKQNFQSAINRWIHRSCLGARVWLDDATRWVGHHPSTSGLKERFLAKLLKNVGGRILKLTFVFPPVDQVEVKQQLRRPHYHRGAHLGSSWMRFAMRLIISWIILTSSRYSDTRAASLAARPAAAAAPAPVVSGSTRFMPFRTTTRGGGGGRRIKSRWINFLPWRVSSAAAAAAALSVVCAPSGAK